MRIECDELQKSILISLLAGSEVCLVGGYLTCEKYNGCCSDCLAEEMDWIIESEEYECLRDLEN